MAEACGVIARDVGLGITVVLFWILHGPKEGRGGRPSRAEGEMTIDRSDLFVGEIFDPTRASRRIHLSRSQRDLSYSNGKQGGEKLISRFGSLITCQQKPESERNLATELS